MFPTPRASPACEADMPTPSSRSDIYFSCRPYAPPSTPAALIRIDSRPSQDWLLFVLLALSALLASLRCPPLPFATLPSRPGRGHAGHSNWSKQDRRRPYSRQALEIPPKRSPRANWQVERFGRTLLQATVTTTQPPPTCPFSYRFFCFTTSPSVPRDSSLHLFALPLAFGPCATAPCRPSNCFPHRQLAQHRQN